MRIAAALYLSGGVPNRGGVPVLGAGRQRSGLRRLSRRADGVNRPLRPLRRFGPSDRENVFEGFEPNFRARRQNQQPRTCPRERRMNRAPAMRNSVQLASPAPGVLLGSRPSAAPMLRLSTGA